MNKPKTGSRRVLKFQTLGDLLADVQKLQASDAIAISEWTPGQIVGHVTAVIEASVEGFTFSVPFPLRVVGKLIKNRSLTKGLPSGLKVPAKAQDAFIPPVDLTFDTAVKRLAETIEKAKQRKMTQVSPIFGKLSHEQWVQLHCRHAELHFGFLTPINQPHDASHSPTNGRSERHAAATA